MPKYSRRYVVVHCEDRTEAERDQWGDSGSFLVDTATDEVVFSDDMEICDATLARGIGELVSILNHQAALLDISRESGGLTRTFCGFDGKVNTY